MSLTQFKQNGIELVIDTATDAAYATQSGYALLAGKDKRTIVKRCKKTKITEIQTVDGKSCELISAAVVFKWLMKDNIELAETAGIVGATVYLHQLAGYKTSNTSMPIFPVYPVLPQTYIEALKTLVKAEEEKERLLIENSLQSAQIEDLEKGVSRLSGVITESLESDYFSILLIVKLNNVNGKLYSWRKLKVASDLKGLKVKQSPCLRYGVKNLYHRDAWKLAYPDLILPTDTSFGTI